MKKYYEEAKYNAAFDRCVDVMSQMLQKYGHQVLDKLEQQAKVQYEYYLTQAKKYDQTIQILHDVNKHIKAIEGLYGAEQENSKNV